MRKLKRIGQELINVLTFHYFHLPTKINIFHSKSDRNVFVTKPNKFKVFLLAKTDGWTYLQIGMHQFNMPDG